LLTFGYHIEQDIEVQMRATQILTIMIVPLFLVSCSTSLVDHDQMNNSSGVPVQYNNISFFLPDGLAGGVAFSTTTNVEYPYINPFFGDMPSHTVITMEGYAVAGRSARILVFNADEYAGYTDVTAATISALRERPKGMLPEALNPGFYVQAQDLSSGSIFGVRYLTEIQTGVAPISNEGLFYYFEGLSDDGTCYIQVFFPVNASFLAATSDPTGTVPEGGIPFPSQAALNSTEMQDYFLAVTQLLEDTQTDAFTPSLLLIDRMVVSIQISH
jgi:hypothetical protein